MPNKNIFLLLFLSFSYLSFGQFSVPGGVTCDQAAPICSDNSGTYVFENNIDNTTNINMQVGCLGDAPRPSWFFLQVDQTGDLAFTINQWQDINNDGINNDGPGTGIDVDFIAWGPFASDTGNCNSVNINCPGCPDNTVNPTFYPNDLDNSNIIDCSWSPQPTETLTINGAQSGEFYLLLIANYGNGPFAPGVDGAIEIVQTNFGTPGSGSTDCSIIDVNGILGPDQNICDMSSIPLDANPNSDPTFVDYTWEFNDGSGFAPIPGTDGLSSISVSNAGEYQVTITDNLGGSDTDVIEITVTALPTVNPVPPQLICDDNNDGIFSFDFTTLNATIIGAQTDVEVSYHNTLTDAQMDMNPITGLYPNAAPYTAETIFIRLENTLNTDCASTGSFTINVFNTPIANAVNDQLICDDNNDGFWDFDLDALRATVLGTQAATDYTVTFHPSPADADANANALPNTYTNQNAYTAETITVRIENNANTGCYATTDFIIDVFDLPTAGVVPPQLICDDDNDGFWDFDLDALQSFVLGTQTMTQYNITFHNSQGNADTGAMPLTSPYTNQVAYQQESIFARIENVDNPLCSATSQFVINVFEQPIPSTYTYRLCDDNADGDDTNGFVDFPLTPSDIDSFVLNGQDPALFTVTYHLNQSDADNNAGAITNLYTDDRQIIARVENNNNTDCYETIQVDLEVNALPVVVNAVSLLQCDTDTDGISDFNLTEAEVLISANPTQQTFTYHLTAADADTGANPIPNTLAYPNTDPSSNPDVLFVRTENADGCHRVSQLDLFVSTTSIPPGFTIPTYQECDDTRVDDNITDGITVFDFSSATPQIVGLFPVGQAITVTYYETTADALAETNAIPDISNHINTASPFNQTITYRIDSDVDNSCLGIGEFMLETINPMPNLNPDPIIVCDDVTVGDLVETIDLTQREAFIFNGETNVSATYHLTYNDAVAANNAIPTPMAYTNTNPAETIFVRITNTDNCFAIVELDLLVNPLPDDSAVVTDYFECENNTDFFFDFDLESKTDEILNGQDPMQYTVTYHESQLDADNLSNPLTSPFTNTSSPQTIYVAITNNTTGCSISTITFNIEINEGAEAGDYFYELCDETNENDGSTQFDLESPDIVNAVIGTQDPDEFTLTFHATEDDAINNENPLPLLYENFDTPQQIIYARVSNNIRPDECYDISEVTLQVNLLPIFDLDDEYILCFTSNDEAIVPVPPILDTGLSATDYTFEWRLDGTVLPTETGPSLTPIQGGIYDVTVTDISTSLVTMCQNFDSALVIESGLPDTFDVEVTSQAFTGNNMIIATATGNSTYEFSLDNGPWQLENEFEDVTGGEHTVYVRDVNGCGIVSRDVTVIDYPKFFTPNGDGNNDTWTIKGINTQPTAVIYIHDRYGKLLKQLSPTSVGWDGTYNGKNMPGTDYWFTLQYTEPTTGETKSFSAHFALKR
ncbi:gliding motility-associated-like protein [Winogradskyella wandonensis]|uniref:Gliding motility-associated-like protein n=1 Tax=Winogradskyella wandonensis TaxID=1442586 RepID=A0A4R1KTX6_9FLAO|nr:T9SS type B sorting domain-containing protein [Winogradskyella wandonensis]TCK68655.1 gliding motility-associated-like protein [Winogradskyella wandonensis]